MLNRHHLELKLQNHSISPWFLQSFVPNQINPSSRSPTFKTISTQATPNRNKDSQERQQSWLAEKHHKSSATTRARMRISLSLLRMLRLWTTGRQTRVFRWLKLLAPSRSLLPTSMLWCSLPLTCISSTAGCTLPVVLDVHFRFLAKQARRFRDQRFYDVDWKQNANGLPIRHGAQGTFDDASKATLENEFGTTNDDEVIKQILEKGTLQETKVGVPHYIPVLTFPRIPRALQQTDPFSTNREQRKRPLRTTVWDPVPVIRYSSLEVREESREEMDDLHSMITAGLGANYEWISNDGR
jgi:hypothetical protein